MSPLVRVALGLMLLPALAGCTATPSRVVTRAMPASPQGVVFVIDGAGAHQDAPARVADAIEAARLPVAVRPFEWSHGLGVGLADLIDTSHSRRMGAVLAAEVRRVQADRPGVPISLVAYSAGSAVALAAAEQLPPDSLACIVLLAPAVSARYDLRRAMMTARGGIDSFSSERDRFWLGAGTAMVGTADGRRDAAAGRVGFCPPRLLPTEVHLSARLRQHPWDGCVAWTGNRGDHGGGLRPAFLRSYVVPLLAQAR